MRPDELESLKEKLEAALRLAEDASNKANSESGFAFNAKQNAEEHARAIAQIRGVVDADQTWLSTTKKNVEEIASAISAAKVAIDTDARASGELRSATEKEAQSLRASNERATSILAVIEKTHAEATSAAADIQSSQQVIAQARVTSEAAASTIQALQAQVTEIAAKVSGALVSVEKSEANALDIVGLMEGENKTAKETHSRVALYEMELKELMKRTADLHSKIEGLLPNATSAGLASAFRNQQSRFKFPQRTWLITFVVSVLLLLGAGVIGLPGFWPGIGQQDSWDAIFRHFVSRLPLIVPLVWLGIFAGRNYMLALRVEEEYAFKEALSTAFEGYKREMAGVSAAGDDAQSPLVVLCAGVLAALASRPGRIYEGKHDDITPLTPLAKALTDAAATLKTVASSNTKA